MRSIGIWTMVFLLAANANAGAPITPTPPKVMPHETAIPERSPITRPTDIPDIENRSATEPETLSVEMIPHSDVAETISATENASTSNAGKSKVPTLTPKPAAAATDDAPKPTDSATATIVEEVTDDFAIDPNQQSIGGLWRSGSPAEGDPYYGRLEFLYWKTSNPAPGGKVFEALSYPALPTAAPTISGSINLNDVHTDYEMGIRALLGRNLTQNFGVELGGLWVYPGTDLKVLFSQPAGVSSTGTATNKIDVIIPSTGDIFGQANMSFRNRYWGTELNGRWHMVNNRVWTFDGLAGARYFDYAERLAFGYNLSNPSRSPDARIERFETNNHMIGGQVGGDVQVAILEYVSLQAINRAAILGNVQDVTVKGPIDGTGRFTSGSNLGSHNAGAATVLLETTPSVVMHLTPDITFQAGYTIIWLNNVMRSHEQVDLSQVGKSPLVSLKTDDMFITGFSFALTANW